MIFDRQGLFSNRQAITVPAVSTDVIDVSTMGRPQHASVSFPKDIGKGREVPIRVQVVETFTGAFTNLEVSIQTDDNEAFSTPKTVMTHSVPRAQCVAGLVIPLVMIPRGTDERYIRLNYNLTGTATATTGRITAGVVAGSDEWWM